MPPLNSRATRALAKKRSAIDGPRSLHRGIHYNLNEDAVRTFRANKQKPRADHRDLLVHHQKINAELQDVYARTAALHGSEATMADRIEESWRQFERIGGKRPVGGDRNMDAGYVGQIRRASDRSKGSPMECIPRARVAPRGKDGRSRGDDGGSGSNDAKTRAVLCANRSAIPYAERLAQVSKEKKELRARASWERETRGEMVDYRAGSALHMAKDKRVRLFQQRQLRRAHLLRRVGDPNPINQSGHYDASRGTLSVFNKTIRHVQRELEHDRRIAAVHDRRPRSRAAGERGAAASEFNVNRPNVSVLRYDREGLPTSSRGGSKRGRRGHAGNTHSQKRPRT